MARAGGQQDVLAVAGRDEQHAALEKLHGVLRAHGADHHVVHQRVQRRRRVQQFGVQFLADQIHGRVARGFVRSGRTPSSSSPLRLRPRRAKSRDVIHFFAKHLVEDDADDFHAFLFKQRLVEADFVNRFADAALA